MQKENFMMRRNKWTFLFHLNGSTKVQWCHIFPSPSRFYLTYHTLTNPQLKPYMSEKDLQQAIQFQIRKDVLNSVLFKVTLREEFFTIGVKKMFKVVGFYTAQPGCPVDVCSIQEFSVGNINNAAPVFVIDVLQQFGNHSCHLCSNCGRR